MKHSNTLKSLFLYGMLMLFTSQANAQNACSNTIFNPKADLTERTFLESDIKYKLNISYRKKGNLPVAPDVQFQNDCGTSITCNTSGADLRYDMYYPQSHNYNQCPLPVFILCHSGGFSDCSSKGTDYYKNVDRLFIGDSITSGYFTGSETNRFQNVYQSLKNQLYCRQTDQ